MGRLVCPCDVTRNLLLLHLKVVEGVQETEPFNVLVARVRLKPTVIDSLTTDSGRRTCTQTRDRKLEPLYRV